MPQLFFHFNALILNYENSGQLSTGHSPASPNFLIFSYFLIYSFLFLITIFISWSLLHCSRNFLAALFISVSYLPMTHLHSPGTFPTLFHRTMPGSRHSYFRFFFSLA